MKDLVIGDVHFGIKSNSTEWLDKQIDFFKTQIYDIIYKESPDRVVFLGDIFDVRYSTNTMVGVTVKELFRDMFKKFHSKRFFIIAGNHDYYSPLIEHERYSTYKMVFGKEFEKEYQNLQILDEGYFVDHDGTAFLPWYWTENEERWSTFLHDNKNVGMIYCHSDLEHWDSGRIVAKGDIKVYSGHIHYPWKSDKDGLHNLGACCAFTFGDVNTSRYVYIINDRKIINYYENTTTPKFRRFYNEEIFTLQEEDTDNSFIQLCIGTSYINKAQYIERIKEIKNTFVNASIKVNVIDDSIVDDIRIREDFNTDIGKYIEDNVPDELKPKYEYIKNKLIENE